MIDADNFKALNDVLGHLVGDRVLRAMADTLRRSVRAFDVCTRFGGEEFAILMPGSNAAPRVQSADRIRQRIEQYRFDPLLIPSDMHPTISVGVAVLAPDNTAQDLIARADRALYVAKAEGKNCVRLATCSFPVAGGWWLVASRRAVAASTPLIDLMHAVAAR